MRLSELSKDIYYIDYDPAINNFEFNDVINEDRIICFKQYYFKVVDNKLKPLFGTYAGFKTLEHLSDNSELLNTFKYEIVKIGELINPFLIAEINIDGNIHKEAFELKSFDFITLELPPQSNINVRFMIKADNFVGYYSEPFNFTTNDFTVYSPQISLNETDYNSVNKYNVIAYLSEFKSVDGSIYASTDWIIEDYNGNVVYESLNDTINKDSFDITSYVTLLPNSRYKIKARYNSSTGSSLFSVLEFKTTFYTIDQIDFPSNLINNSLYSYTITVDKGSTPSYGNLVVQADVGNITINGFSFDWDIPDVTQDTYTNLTIYIEDGNGTILSNIINKNFKIKDIDVDSDTSVIYTSVIENRYLNNIVKNGDNAYSFNDNAEWVSTIVEQESGDNDWRLCETKFSIKPYEIKNYYNKTEKQIEFTPFINIEKGDPLLAFDGVNIVKGNIDNIIKIKDGDYIKIAKMYFNNDYNINITDICFYDGYLYLSGVVSNSMFIIKLDKNYNTVNSICFNVQYYNPGTSNIIKIEDNKLYIFFNFYTTGYDGTFFAIIDIDTFDYTYKTYNYAVQFPKSKNSIGNLFSKMGSRRLYLYDLLNYNFSNGKQMYSNEANTTTSYDILKSKEYKNKLYFIAFSDYANYTTMFCIMDKNNLSSFVRRYDNLHKDFSNKNDITIDENNDIVFYLVDNFIYYYDINNNLMNAIFCNLNINIKKLVKTNSGFIIMGIYNNDIIILKTDNDFNVKYNFLISSDVNFNKVNCAYDPTDNNIYFYSDENNILFNFNEEVGVLNDNIFLLEGKEYRIFKLSTRIFFENATTHFYYYVPSIEDYNNYPSNKSYTLNFIDFYTIDYVEIGNNPIYLMDYNSMNLKTPPEKLWVSDFKPYIMCDYSSERLLYNDYDVSSKITSSTSNSINFQESGSDGTLVINGDKVIVNGIEKTAINVTFDSGTSTYSIEVEDIGEQITTLIIKNRKIYMNILEMNVNQIDSSIIDITTEKTEINGRFISSGMEIKKEGSNLIFPVIDNVWKEL